MSMYPISKEELNRLYRIERKKLKDIAQETEISYATLHFLLQKYRINKNKNLDLVICNRDTLYEEYIVQNKTRQQIAKECKVSDAFVKKKLRQFNIKKPVELYHQNTVKGCKDLQKQIVTKRSKTMLKRYGVEHYTVSEDFIEKARNTLDKNKTWTTSKSEDKVYNELLKKFPKTLRQYSSKEYPFNCDFYVPELNLYIEYQGTWSHGRRVFNPNDLDCINTLNKWKDRLKQLGPHSRYADAIKVWTVRDPLKRKTAKDNNLNWIEFFSMKEFKEWYNAN